MYFDNFAELFNMGGYGSYVWPAYALTFVVLAYNQITPILRKKYIVKKIKELQSNRSKDSGL